MSQLGVGAGNATTKNISAPVWESLRLQAEEAARREPVLAGFFNAAILSHESLMQALCYQLAQKAGGPDMNALQIREVCKQAFMEDDCLMYCVERDLRAVLSRDPACRTLLQPFLFFKGFLALQTHRVAHWLWHQDRDVLAFFLQSRTSELYGVDIHPAAKMGCGIMMDHATGVVIGETAVVGDDCSFMHGVNLGGTGKEFTDRHPKIGKGVLIGADAKILGNIKVGDKARIGASSVVLEDVRAGCTVAGVPAKVIACVSEEPAETMDHLISPE